MSVKDKIAAQNQQPVAGTQVSSISKPANTTPKPTKPTSNRAKIASQNTQKTASNGTQNSSKKTSSGKKVTTVQDYNKLAQQKKEEREVKVRDMMTTRNQHIINASTSGQDIYDGIQQGQVSSETIDQLAQTNPTVYEDYMKVTEDQASLKMMAFVSGQMEKLSGYADTIRQSFLSEFEALGDSRVGTKELYDKYVDSEDTLAKGEVVTTIENEMEELQITMDGIEGEIRGQYDGKASESFIQAMISKRQKDLIPLFRKKESEYRKAQLDYNSALQQGQVEFQFALEDARYEEQRQADILQTKYNMTMQAFTEQKETILKGIDFAQQEYFNKKSFDQQVYLTNLSNEMGVEKAKAMMEYEYALKDQYGLFDTVSAYMPLSDGRQVGLNSNGGIVSIFDPNTAGFQLNMDVQRPAGSTNVGRDVNNPGNITADGFTTPEAKASYGARIGAVGTYTSPNGREYYVFPDQESGARALRMDITAKVSGGSSHISPTDSIAQLIKIYTGDSDVNSGYGKAVLNALGVHGATPINMINPDDIANALAMAEGFGDISGLGYSQLPQFSDEGSSLTDIHGYNNPTFKPQDLKPGTPEYNKYNNYLKERKAIMDNKDASLEDILYYSAGGANLTDTSIQQLDKYTNSFEGVSAIWGALQGGDEKTTVNVNGEKSKVDFAPVEAFFRKRNPRDVSAGEIEALTNSTVPGLARGVYGEVGVLTDNDIKIYKSTLPNISQPAQLQEVVMAMSIKRIMNGYHNKLRTEAAAGRDVSGFVGAYRSLETTYNQIMNGLGGSSSVSSAPNAASPGAFLFNMGTQGYSATGAGSVQVNFTPYTQ